MLKKLLIVPLGLSVLLYALAGLYLAFAGQLPVWFGVLLAVLLLFPLPLLPLAHALPNGKMRTIVHRTGEAVIGIYLYFLIYLLLFSTLCYIQVLFSLSLPISLLAALFFGAFLLTILIATLHGRKLRVRRLTLRLPGKENGIVRIVFFSDLHLGRFTTKELLTRLTEKVNAENADYIFFGGDLFDSDFGELKHIGEAEKALSAMRSRSGFFACPGNHDAYADGDCRRDAFLRKCGITMLRDEIREEPLFTLWGRKDSCETDRKDESFAAGLAKPLLVLDHRPFRAGKLLKSGASLVLCGHTHGGQTFPGNLALKLYAPFGSGLKQNENGAVYTTTGAGYWGVPLRIGVTGEIAVLELNFRKSEETSQEGDRKK